MNGETLSLPEISALLVLMAEAREISNPDLRLRYGMTLDGVHRRRLNELKLVESRRVGRAYAHVLTDDGWAMVGERVRAGVTMPSGSAGAVSRALLAGLDRFLGRTDQRLADVFQPEADQPDEGQPDENQPGDVEARIRDAYGELADRPGAWVRLARLRDRLGDAPRADVDAALRRMDLTPHATLAPESNQKTLTQRDRDAAVVVGEQDKHLLSIGQS